MKDYLNIMVRVHLFGGSKMLIIYLFIIIFVLATAD